MGLEGAGGAGGRKKTIILTGGGTAGHVIPNMILLPDLLADGWDVHYIGSREGVEASLAKREGVTYHAISTGKLRRYFDVKNFVDPFRIVAGVAQSMRIIARLRPAVIFSKGGFVATPPVIAGRLLGVPSVIHESDRTPGLANRICAPFATKICLSFEETFADLPEKARGRAAFTGAPVRAELGAGLRGEGLRMCGFDEDRPVLLAIGGSQGSAALNRIVRAALPELLRTWQVAHVCGRGNADASYGGVKGYAQFEFVGEELAHLYKISRAAVSRAGSNTIFELLYLRIPSILIPLPMGSSRGDQLRNATDFEKKGFCIMMEENAEGAPGALIENLQRLESGYDGFVRAMQGAKTRDAKDMLLKTIYGAARFI